MDLNRDVKYRADRRCQQMSDQSNEHEELLESSFSELSNLVRISGAVFGALGLLTLMNLFRLAVKSIRLTQASESCRYSSDEVGLLGVRFSRNVGAETFSGCDAFVVRLWYERKILLYVFGWEAVSCVVLMVVWWRFHRTMVQCRIERLRE